MPHALRPVIVLMVAVLSIAGCKKDQPPKEEPTTEEPVQEEPTNEPAGEEPPPAHSSSIPGTENQLYVDQAIPEVSFDLTAPEDGATLESGDFEITFDVKNYRTGREIGQHVHVIIDNEPYKAHYDASKPLKIEGLAEGTHTIRAFPARHYHLSLKEGNPFDVHTFHVKKKSEDFSFDPSKPYVTYSRPKGSYSVDAAKNLLLDFYVQNAELGKDAKVIYSVDGKPTELAEWKPVLIGPLAAGEHEINLKLVDMDGKLIENGGYNDTTRKITVK